MTTRDARRSGRSSSLEARRQLDACLEKLRHCAGQLDDDQLWSARRAMAGTASAISYSIWPGNLGHRFGSTIGGDPDCRDRAAEFAERRPIPGARPDRPAGAPAGRRSQDVLDGLTPAQVGEPRSYPTADGSPRRRSWA